MKDVTPFMQCMHVSFTRQIGTAIRGSTAKLAGKMCSHGIVLSQLDQLRLSALCSQLSTPDMQLSFLEGMLCSHCSPLHGLRTQQLTLGTHTADAHIVCTAAASLPLQVFQQQTHKSTHLTRCSARLVIDRHCYQYHEKCCT